MRLEFWAPMLALALVGCTTSKRSEGSATSYPGAAVSSSRPAPPSPTRPPEVIVTPSNANVGKVTSVNPGARFAVITFSLGNVPGANRRLGVYRAGLKVGEIKITGPARDNNTVGDILAGECQVNDEVKEE
jgi:hypothetical protein